MKGIDFGCLLDDWNESQNPTRPCPLLGLKNRSKYLGILWLDVAERSPIPSLGLEAET